MNVNSLTLNKLIRLSKKHGIEILCKQLATLPVKDYTRIGFKLYKTPQSVKEFTSYINWGQRLYMATNHDKDIESFLYFTACYIQGLRDKKYDEAKIVGVFNQLRRIKLKDLYPLTVKIQDMFIELIKNETEKLYKPIDPKMRAAEVERLSVFSEFQTLEYLANRYKCSLDEAYNIPYDLALTFLWEKKEVDEFSERYTEILKTSTKKTA